MKKDVNTAQLHIYMPEWLRQEAMEMAATKVQSGSSYGLEAVREAIRRDKQRLRREAAA